MVAKITREVQTEEEAYADAEYRKFLKEKSQYKDFDEFCVSRGFNLPGRTPSAMPPLHYMDA